MNRRDFVARTIGLIAAPGAALTAAAASPKMPGPTGDKRTLTYLDEWDVASPASLAGVRAAIERRRKHLRRKFYDDVERDLWEPTSVNGIAFWLKPKVST